MASIQKNFIYNVSITISNYVAGLIVFPYITRCLGVELLGKVNFVDNIITYFGLFSVMGIITVGTRDIASSKSDSKELSRTFSSLLVILSFLTLVSLIVLVTATFFVPKLEDYRSLLIIGTFALLFTSFQIEWFYQGLEDFSYIAKRSIIIKTLYCVCIFLFIKDKDDYFLYYVLTISSAGINCLINLLHTRNYLTISFKDLDIKKYFKPIFSYGLYRILISMYTTFNVLYLGYVTTDIHVGYYTTSTKLFQILLGVISAYTMVLLPRMSSLLNDKSMGEFERVISQSFNIILSLAIPCCIGGVILAPQLINILAGEGYEGAILPMQILMPVLVLTSLAQIGVIQVLIPMKKDNTVLNASIVGAIVGISVNILIVKEMGAIGSAVVLLCSELASDIFCFAYIFKNRLIKMPVDELLKQALGGLPYVIICYYIVSRNISSIITVVLSFVICLVYYIILNLLIRKDTATAAIIKKNLGVIKNYIK